MKQYDVENFLISCIIQRPQLIEKLFIDLNCFKNEYNKQAILFMKRFYKEFKTFDISLMVEKIKGDEQKSKFIYYFTEMIQISPSPSLFYSYQQQMIDDHKNELIKKEISKIDEIGIDELVENINKINNETMIIKQTNKKTPDEMLSMIRNKDKLIQFDRFDNLNKRLKIKRNTVNIIGARPSEGKSALALNLFCDLSKEYKCLYFNMEMTEEEVYERMLGIEANIAIKYINSPETEYQDKVIKDAANKIYNHKYEIINGSKTVKSIKSKIINEQRNEHVVVFIDYVGYIVGKAGQSDRERIGEATRELNNITKDYDCTIFLICQINRNGSEEPTMQDLKDSGEIEQTGDTIILIHDANKNDNSDIKEISLLIPKCRGSKRNVKIPVVYDKSKQRMEVKNDFCGRV